ncbi:replication protein A 70 kDa DNA-binding subunit B [Tanacetum coccineum]
MDDQSEDSFSLETILCQQQSARGTTIHATIRAGFISDFDKLLEEHSDFLISNFGVKKNIDGTKLTPHQYKLHFLKKTNVRHCQDFTCANDDDGLQLLSFQDFNNTTFDTAYAFDVIGRLINNKDITVLNGKNGSKKSSLEFELQDLKGDKIRCILWNDLAEKLHKYIKENENSQEPIIILIIMAKYSTWNHVTQVSNCFYGTKILINENNPRIIDFKTSFLGSEIGASEDTKIELSTNTVYKKPSDSYTRFPVKNIEELYEISEATGCVIIAKVLRIVADQGWYYMICNKCKSKANKSQTTNCYNCGRCDEEVSDVYPRIKVQIRMQDETGSTSFWLFQQEICKLIDKSPGYLISKAKKDLDNTSYPEDLNVTLNKQYVLKVQVFGYNLNNIYHIFTANKTTDDEDVIKSVIAKHTMDKETQVSFEDDNTHSEVGNMYQDKKLIADIERPSSEVGIKRKEHVGDTKITKIAKINED